MMKNGGIIGQKMGYDRCPYLSFFDQRPEKRILI
jgi:hypothetical protein